MNIHDIKGLQGSIQSTSGTQTVTPSADFQKILAERLKTINETAAPSEVSAAGKIAPTNPMLRIESLELTEAALSSLESYEAALANHSLTTDQIEPLVSLLEEETTGLLQLKGQLDADDPLAGMLERVAAVTFLESAKFRRGDYSA